MILFFLANAECSFAFIKKLVIFTQTRPTKADFQRRCDIFQYYSYLRQYYLYLQINYMFCFRFTCDMSYFVLAFSLSSLHGNKYLNVAISCLMDLSAVLIFIWLLPR